MDGRNDATMKGIDMSYHRVTVEMGQGGQQYWLCWVRSWVMCLCLSVSVSGSSMTESGRVGSELKNSLIS